jgi:putative radical SAM enzyme (TIGR03279 family)
MMGQGVVIREVIEGSLGEQLGMLSGDRLISINGQPVRDLIDIEFYQAESEVVMVWENIRGERQEFALDKDPDESLGLVADPPAIKRCPNKCDFCFVDQMPQGQRKTLYIRDEDYRYSFLYGNFITLTNLSEKDFQRVIEQRLSPLYISVHATDPDVRKILLRNDHAPNILDMIDKLIAGGIRLNTQIVLMPGVNDGDILDRSIEDLSSRYPGVNSLAVVPVGLTNHRDNLPSVRSIDMSYARKALRKITQVQQEMNERLGDPFIFPADEWYILAEKKFPSVSRYGTLPQIGNGVGMVPLFESEWKRWIRRLKSQETLSPPLPWVLVTGKAFSEVLRSLISLLEERLPSWRGAFEVCEVENQLFGPSVTVAGLLAAGDIISGVQKYLSCRTDKMLPISGVLIPDVVLKSDSEVFLDDGCLDDVRNGLGVTVYQVPSDARGFSNWIAQMMQSPESSWQPMVLSL